MATLLLVDLGVRLTDLQAHYTDAGCLPREQVIQSMWNPAYWSLHMAAGHWTWQLALFAVAGAANLSLLLGYRTRLSGMVAWLLLVSLQTRSQLVLDGGDLYYRCLLFWLMFSRWGERWSVDAQGVAEPDPQASWSVPDFAYVVQLSLIYVFAFLHKSGAEWRSEGSAVGYSLQIEQLTRPLGTWLLNHEAWLQPLTWGVLLLEGLIPVLLWLGLRGRLVGVVALTALHLGLSMCFYLGLFGPMAIVASWGLIPGWVWERFPAAGREWSRLLARLPLRGRPDVPVGAAVQFVLLCLLLRVAQWNYTEWDGRHVVLFPQELHALRLDQRWDMFSPRPLREDGYYVIVGETHGGVDVDVWRDRLSVEWSKPVPLAPDYPNARWRKLMMNLWDSRHAAWRRPLLQYLCRRWNARHPEQKLRSVQMYFVVELSLPGLQTAPLEVRPLAYYCPQQWLHGSEPDAHATLENAREVLQALDSAGK
jgi:hypothetical protein